MTDKEFDLKGFNGIIFLDIDGCLNDDVSFYEQTKNAPDDWIKNKDEDVFLRGLAATQIAPKFVEQLNRILTTCNVGIVLSSSWRIGKCREALFYAGIDNYAERLLGYTPVGTQCEYNSERGKEIQAWMAENNYHGPFVILDDEADMAHLLPYLVQTNWHNRTELPKSVGGLHKWAADRVIGRFQGVKMLTAKEWDKELDMGIYDWDGFREGDIRPTDLITEEEFRFRSQFATRKGLNKPKNEVK